MNDTYQFQRHVCVCVCVCTYIYNIHDIYLTRACTQGEFEFNFDLACITHRVGGARSRPSTAANNRVDSDNKDGVLGANNTLSFGNFTVSPANGTVAPNGEKETITVEFNAVGQAQFFEVMRVFVCTCSCVIAVLHVCI